MRTLLLFVVAIVLLVLGIVVLPKLTGPKMYVVRVGEFTNRTTETNRFKVKSPSPSAWFGGLILVVEDGVLQPEGQIEMEVFQNGRTVLRKAVQCAQLLDQNQAKRNSFVVSLRDANVSGSAQDAFGYGHEFEVCGSLLSSSNERIAVYAKFVDDRLLKN